MLSEISGTFVLTKAGGKNVCFVGVSCCLWVPLPPRVARTCSRKIEPRPTALGTVSFCNTLSLIHIEHPTRMPVIQH
jgi:hypothetical protein